MNRLVLHHLYAHSAFDLSNNRNHGLPLDVSVATAPDAPGFRFAAGDSQVRVEPSPTLAQLGSIRAVITFNLDPGGPLVRRYNLIEGHLSFALFVNPDGSLQGTILDADDNWTGAKSATGLITPGRWHSAELQHDGINQVRLLLDGALVGSTFDARGPVRSVGPHGVAIGHWPESSGVYTFAGWLREAWLYKYDPYKDANGLLDPCCTDRAALAAAAEKLRAEGQTADSLAAKGHELLDFGYEMVAAVRGGDEAVTKTQEALSQLAWACFLRGDPAGYTTALGQLAGLAQGRLSHAQQQAFDQKRTELIKSLPLPMKELQGLIKTMCWDKVGIDPQQLAEVATKKRGRSHDGGPVKNIDPVPAQRGANA